MPFRNPEIYAAIIAKGENYTQVAEAVGMPLNTFNKKMQGRRRWQEGELDKVKVYLGLKGGPIPDLNVKCKPTIVKGDQNDDQSRNLR